MDSLLEILVALCGAELVHNSVEIWGIRRKVSWLDLIQTGQEHGQWPLNINTRYKMIALHSSILVLTTGPIYFILKALNLSDHNLAIVGVVVLLINYICTTWYVDRCHSQVGKMIAKAKK